MIEERLKKEFCYLRDRIIEKRYQHLDPMQREAVFYGHGNCIVVACPGSGKTTVIINRIDYLCTFGPVYNTDYVPSSLKPEDLRHMREYLNNDTSGKTVVIVNRVAHLINDLKIHHNNIIVITFTRAAAINMRNRYIKINGSYKVPFFGTFHGLFYKILKNYYGELNIIGEGEAYKLIKNLLMSYLDEVSDEKVKEVLNNISLFKTSGIELEEFCPSIDKSIFSNAYNIYEMYKKEKNLLDFDDLQIHCRDLFLKNGKLLEGYRNLFKYILVDEFQDCDGMQIEILKMLNSSNSLFAVGDEDQCIYGFRGSRPDCMVDFAEHFNQSLKLPLSTNYRSTNNIVNLSMNVIKNNAMRNDKEIVAHKNYEGKITIVNTINESIQAEQITNVIESIKITNLSKKDDNFNYNDNAVLYRTNVESRSIIDACIRKKIPFKLLDKEYNFFEHFICKDLISYLKLSLDKTDKDSFLRIINKPFRYISKINLDNIKRSNLKEDCFEMLKSIDSMPTFQMKNIDELKKDIHNLNKMSLNSALSFIIGGLGYYDYIREYCIKFKIDVTEMEDIIEEFKEAASEYNSIISFLAHVEEVKEEIAKNKREDNKDALILSTIHGVKGMEFKNVFIINCMEENIPHINSMDKNIEEERRLFYVGVTRAIYNLWLCIPKSVKGKMKETSRFIKECNIDFSNASNLPFKKGEKVIHKSFGQGEVVFIDEKNIEIKFSGDVTRLFAADVLYNNGLINSLKE